MILRSAVPERVRSVALPHQNRFQDQSAWKLCLRFLEPLRAALQYLPSGRRCCPRLCKSEAQRDKSTGFSSRTDQIYSGYSGLQINTGSLLESKGQDEPVSKHIYIHVFMRLLHGLGGEAHVFKDFGVGVGIFQGFPLELNGRERPVDPGELLFIPLFPF